MQIISMTSPEEIRSIRLPIAPPVMAATHHNSGFFLSHFFATTRITIARYTTVITTNSHLAPRSRLSAMPSFVI